MYTAHDDRRPSVLIIIIENVGASPAFDVQFKLSREIPKDIWSSERSSGGQRLKVMREGPLIDGIRVLGPSSRRVLTWGTYDGLREAMGNTPVKVTVTFESRGRFPWNPTEHTSDSELEIRSFLGTDASKPPELRSVTALEGMAKDLAVIARGARIVAGVVQEPEAKLAVERFRRTRQAEADHTAPDSVTVERGGVLKTDEDV